MHFGVDAANMPVERLTIRSDHLTAHVLTWGAVLQDLRLEGVPHALVLGYDQFAPYLSHSANFGAVVGRVANRIRGARAMIGGHGVALDKNCLGRHTLHGGAGGAGVSHWSIAEWGADAVRLTLTEADGHMGFPGTLVAEVTYRVVDASLHITLEATADRETLCNLAHHSYFNLDGSGDARAQHLRINADAYLPVDEDLCPTGEVRPVAGSPFDFRTARSIGDHGYDHNFCLSPAPAPLRPVAVLKGPETGISMGIETTEPGLQLYDGVSIPANGPPGLNGVPYGPYSGIALEAQRWPDAPHQAWADQVTLSPCDAYRQETVFRFSAP